MKVTVIAFGTRGDVQPLVILAAGLAGQSWCSEAVLVTHTEHSHFVHGLLQAPGVPGDRANREATTTTGDATNGRKTTKSLATFVPVDSPPIIWKGVAGSDAAEERATRAQQDACMQACQGAGLVVFNMFALEGYHVADKMQIPCVVCQPYLMATPMPSSFPRRMRRAYPLLFRRLTRGPDTSALLSTSATAHLEESPHGAQEAGAVPPGSERSLAASSPNCTTDSRGDRRIETAWSHVEHWMWPLFTDRWGAFRERLELHPCPLADSDDEVPPEAEAEAARDEAFSRGEGGGPKNMVRTIDPASLPAVLYCFSPLVVDKSPFWPESVKFCGYLYPPQVFTAQGRTDALQAGGEGNGETVGFGSVQEPVQKSAPRSEAADADAVGETNDTTPGVLACLPLALERFLSKQEDRPLYVGFGSMWAMCPPDYGLAYALRVVLLGAREAGARCVVILPAQERHRHVGGAGDSDVGRREEAERLREVDIAAEFVLREFAASASVGQDDLLIHRGPIAHDLLLPRCSTAIHHGGSGTTAAVLRAGIPHVICPQQLDQFFWAERVRYLAVGSVLERSLFVGCDSLAATPPASVISKAASAILSALTPQRKLRSACLGVKIRGENGLDTTLESLSRFVRSRNRTPSTPPSLLSAPSDTSPSDNSMKPSTWKAGSVEGSGVGFAEQVAEPGGVTTTAAVLESDNRSAHDDKAGGEPDGGDGLLILREMPNGVKVWCGRRAEEEAFFVFGEVFEDRTYAKMGLRVKDGDTVWDVGANVGLASIFFELETDAPDCIDLYAFEPVPLNRKALTWNLSAHCPTAVVLGYALGAANEDGACATFYPRMPGNSTLRPREKERLQGGHMLHDAVDAPPFEATRDGAKPRHGSMGSFFADAEKVSCNVRTVSWAMADLGVNKIDLLKVDVEGAELDVLLGIDERDWPKIKQVVAEVHPVGDRVMRVCNLLRDHGFEVSAQALGLNGTPIAPNDGEDICTAAEGIGLEWMLQQSSTTTPPRTNRTQSLPRSGPGATSMRTDRDRREGDLGKGEVDPASDSPSRIDHAGIAGPRDSGQHDAVVDGIVFMVYAKRLRC